MNDWEKCQEFQRLADILEKHKKVPRDFCEHTKQCKICLFWTSYTLAATEALMTTDRLFNQECPSQYHFERLIYASIAAAKFSKSKKPLKNVFPLDGEELIHISPAIDHINHDCPSFCSFCRKYYDDLFDAMMKLAPRYKKRLLTKKDIRIVKTNTSQQINASEFGYYPSKKTN